MNESVPSAMSNLGQILDDETPRSLVHRSGIPQRSDIEGNEIPERVLRHVCIRSERRKLRMVVKVKVWAEMAHEMEEQVADKDKQDQRHDERRPCLGRKRRLKRGILRNALAQRRFGRGIEERDVKLRRVAGW